MSTVTYKLDQGDDHVARIATLLENAAKAVRKDSSRLVGSFIDLSYEGNFSSSIEISTEAGIVEVRLHGPKPKMLIPAKPRRRRRKGKSR